jgi:hypothetical protein
MSDITKCSGTGCPKKSKCFRFTATASEWGQSYFAEVPYDKEKKTCGYFWKIVKNYKVTHKAI